MTARRGRPEGSRDRYPRDLAKAALMNCRSAVEALGEVVSDKQAPPLARVLAAQTLLERAYGPSKAISSAACVKGAAGALQGAE